MSVISKASFVQIPSGYGEDKLYSEVPNTTAGDFTFTRASTGTRVNADGFIEEVPWNKSTYSEDFTNGNYIKNNCVVIADQADSPTGTTTADQIDFGTGSGFFYNALTAITQPSTYSVYVKYIDYQFIQIIGTGDVDHYANFDIQNGIVGNTGSQSTASIVDAGNGWYRCIINYNSGTFSGGARLYKSTSLTAGWAGGGGIAGSFYFWGNQLVKGNAPKPYIKTTDRLNVPRLDYTNRNCPQILIEKSATNSIAYSEDYTSGNWNTSNTTITPNSIIAPSGLNVGSLITANGTNPRLTYNVGVGTGSFVFSWFAKKGTSSYLKIRVYDGSTNHDAIFDLETGTLTSGNGVIQPYINDWYKCSLVYNSNGNTHFTQTYVSNTSTGNLYLWGCQLENKYSNQGYKPTSYIPTNGTSVTRNFDYFKSGDLTSVLNTSQGVLFLDFKHYDSIVYGEFLVRPTDNSTTNQLSFRTQNINNPDRNITQFSLTASGTSYGNYQWNDAYINMGVKYAFAWDGNVIKHYINGVKKSETTATFSFSADFGEIKMSRYNTPNEYLSFHNPLRQVAYFNEMLTEDELVTLTTPVATTFEALAEYWAYELL